MFHKLSTLRSAARRRPRHAVAVGARRGSPPALLVSAVMIALGVLLPAGQAHAIIGGAPDGNGHPYVGAVGPPRPIVASGVLISPTVVLTAAHVAERRLGPGAARVTFDPVADASATWHTGTAYPNPAYDPSAIGDSSEAYDLGVIVLDAPVAGITPASLPTEGLLDQLGPQGLSRASFTGVGYGLSRRSDDGGKPGRDLTSGGTRRVAQQSFASLGRQYLRLRMEGGADVCSGDSGGPSLLGSSNVVAGTLAIEWSLAGGECLSNPWYQRVDTPPARAFLGQYVTLP